ncbi:MAG TPA: preprotein translocase subunit YajC [Wenzhouxiangellaceae bacterium]|nr:preprotein translocase subunit YajC [Wenzhouxiangellaceae bacterium]
MHEFLSELLIPSAMAQAAGEQPSMLASILPLVFIVVIFWLLIIRPQMKRTKQHRELVSNLAVDDEIVSAGGLLGKVTEVGDNFIKVELADGVLVKMQKSSVGQVVPKGTFDSAA